MPDDVDQLHEALRLVRTIVPAMGGTITLDSTVAVGTTFTVVLPRRAA